MAVLFLAGQQKGAAVQGQEKCTLRRSTAKAAGPWGTKLASQYIGLCICPHVGRVAK